MQKKSERKARARQLIQAGGLLYKSGLIDAFRITPGDDLQDYETREKATELLGFLVESFEKNSFEELNLGRWGSLGKKRLK